MWWVALLGCEVGDSERLGVGECLGGVVGGAWGRRLGLNKKSINQLLLVLFFYFKSIYYSLEIVFQKGSFFIPHFFIPYF